MLTIQLLVVFTAAIFLTAAQVLDEFITIIKNDRKKALFWGFLSWVLAGTIIVNIHGSVLVKTISILFAGFGSALGNLLGIELITILKKQKRSGKPFMKLALAELKKSSLMRMVKQAKVYRTIKRKMAPRKKLPDPQPEAIF
jgi:hypothetical protein